MKFGRMTKAVLSLLVIMLFAGFFPGNDDIYFRISRNMDLLGKVLKEITFNYVDDVNPDEFMRAGIKGMLGSLDPYTIFVDETRKDDIDLITNGKYGGIGISIGVRGDDVTVVEVLDGYSAQKQGLRIGDILIEAAGQSISVDNIDEISALVKGEPGTGVHLRILRNERKDTLDFNLIREEIVIKNLTYYGFYPENSNNVYLKLSNFSRSASEELRKALKELKAEREIKSIILDLRNNPGGLLDVAVDICDKFLAKNQLIVTTRGRSTDDDKHYYSIQEPMIGEARLVVLINEGSASASEIVAGAFQDHDRGVILGTKSFGKGLVQTITPLSYNTSLKITTARYYTPTGRSIQKIDYSKKNKVITKVDSVISTPYQTDNQRIVYSAGGITPDSIVVFEVQGGLTKYLLAQAFFFKFADHFYYQHPAFDYKTLNNEKLFSDFKNYLTGQDFNYHSEGEKSIDVLIADAEKNQFNKQLIADLNKVKEHYSKIENSEFEIYKDEILRELRSELAARYLGPENKIKEQLPFDRQFQTALDIITDKFAYDKLLNIY